VTALTARRERLASGDLEAVVVVRTRIVVAVGRGSLRATLDAALTESGFQVTSRCGTARAAVEAVARDRPDICIIDAELPGGALVAAAAIASPPAPPAVLVIDPGAGKAELRAAELAGASGVLREVDEDRLADLVKAAAKRRAMEQ
jgi:DNA-binding NarL/FixJ family response regulator